MNYKNLFYWIVNSVSQAINQGFGCVLTESYGTNLGEKFAAQALEKYYETSVQPLITNSDYEKLLSPGGSYQFSVLTYGDVTINDYTKGSAITPETLTESEGSLDPDQQKMYYFKIPSLTAFESYVSDPGSALLKRAGDQLKTAIDTYILGLYADTGSGNRVGTNYTVGSVSVTATAGAVTATAASASAWASSMVGLGFKATGHTKWYRIESVNTATTLTIMNDSDDDAQTYDGGEIEDKAEAVPYVIEAATPVAITIGTTDMIPYIDKLAMNLDRNEIPKSDRWLVVNSYGAAAIRTSAKYTPAVESAYQNVTQKGLIGFCSGFQVYQNEHVYGDNTSGYYILVGHKSAITFAMEFTESGIEDLVGDFGKAYKGLVVYGAKILDERRKALAYFFCTFA